MLIKGVIKIFASNTLFAASFILAYILVLIMAVFLQYGSYWEDAAWVMTAMLGVLITLTAMISTAEAIESKSWPRVFARLIHTSLDSRSSGDSNGHRIYSPKVEYEYKYHGESFIGREIDFSHTFASKEWAQGIIDDIEKQGSKFQVFVNPAEPSVSVIYPGLKFVHIIRFVVGPVLICLPIAYWLGFLQRFI